MLTMSFVESVEIVTEIVIENRKITIKEFLRMSPYHYVKRRLRKEKNAPRQFTSFASRECSCSFIAAYS